MTINPIHSIGSVHTVREPKEQKRFPEGPSKELLALVAALKESLKGLSDWILRYALMQNSRNILLPPSEGASLSVAARELSQKGGVFRNAHAALLSYSQQIPEPKDRVFAIEILASLERNFTEEIGRETSCELGALGFTSWSALLISSRETHWTLPLVQQLLRQIPPQNWKNARDLLNLLRNSF